MKPLMFRSSPQSFSGVMVMLLLLSCNGESPTSPVTPPSPPAPPVPNQSGTVWGFVRDPSGACLRGAVVEVLDGPRAGARMTQDNCDQDYGFSFRDLPANTNVRMRASKEGYQSLDLTFFAKSGPTQPEDISVFVLQPAAPPDPTFQGIVFGYIYDSSHGCLSGAVVEVLDGARAGSRAVQVECTPAWEDDTDYGFTFRDLPANTSVRMRASREGFQSQELTFSAKNAIYPEDMAIFVLPPR